LKNVYLVPHFFVLIFMKTYFHHTNWLIEKLFPNYTWKIHTDRKVIYLTFDDGPIPYLTEWVLETLEKFEAKGTFFCVGDNIGKYPAIFEKIIAQGHRVGNHTFNHLDSWKTPEEKYVQNIALCQEQIHNLTKSSEKKLFRPPYGKLRSQHFKRIANDYQIIMWHVLSGDFDVNLDPKVCLQKCLDYTKEGSIVVFHDNLKAEKNIYYALPLFLKHFQDLGYSFEVLP